MMMICEGVVFSLLAKIGTMDELRNLELLDCRVEIKATLGTGVWRYDE